MTAPKKPVRPLATPRQMTEAKPEKSVGFLVFVLVGGTIVLLLGGLGFLFLFVQDSVETAAREAEWSTVSSDTGGFSAELPAELEWEEMEVPGRNWTMHIGSARVGDVAFEVTYFDTIPTKNPRDQLDLRDIMTQVGGSQKGRFGEFEPRNLEIYLGQYILVNLDNGRQTHAWGIRRASRIYLLAAHNLRLEDADLAEKFFGSFTLNPIIEPRPVHVDGSPHNPGDRLRPNNYSVAMGTPIRFERGQLQREEIGFENGSPPYQIELIQKDLPGGLMAVVVGEVIRISGTPAAAGKYSVNYRVTDASRQVLEATIKLDVIDNVFTVSVEGLRFADGVAEVRKGDEISLTFKLNGPVAEDPRLPSWLDEEIPPGLTAGPGDGKEFTVSGKCSVTGKHAVRVNVLVKSAEDGEEYECRYEVILNVSE